MQDNVLRKAEVRVANAALARQTALEAAIAGIGSTRALSDADGALTDACHDLVRARGTEDSGPPFEFFGGHTDGTAAPVASRERLAEILKIAQSNGPLLSNAMALDLAHAFYDATERASKANALNASWEERSAEGRAAALTRDVRAFRDALVTERARYEAVAALLASFREAIDDLQHDSERRAETVQEVTASMRKILAANPARLIAQHDEKVRCKVLKEAADNLVGMSALRRPIVVAGGNPIVARRCCKACGSTDVLDTSQSLDCNTCGKST